MLRPMTFLIRRILPVLVCGCAFGQDVEFAELMKHPDAYRGREVIVTAGYHEGFERMELTCFADRQAAAWVKFDPEVKGGQKLRSADHAFDNVWKVRVRGVLQGDEKSTFGHMNGWRYRFIVKEILSASLIWRFHGNPKGIPERVKLSACRQRLAQPPRVCVTLEVPIILGG